MSRQFENKVVLVTGAAGGIGRATALAFAREGARVVVSDLAGSAIEETAALVRQAGAEVSAFAADIGRSDQVRALVAAAVERYGRLDIAHNNAGVMNPLAQILGDDAEADFDHTMGVNARGTYLCMKYEIAQMLAQGGPGAIVNTASALGQVGMPSAIAYAASKHAVVGMTRAAALEFAPAGIRINAVCPGTIRTPMVADSLNIAEVEKFMIEQHPIGRLGTAEEIASAVLWLASPGASFAVGTILAVDGGYIAR